MPSITCAVAENADHIFQPIMLQLAHRLVDSLDLSSVIGDQIYIETDWSTHSKTSTIEQDAVVQGNQFAVEASVQLNPTSQKWDCYTFQHTTAFGITPQILNNNIPIYYDKENSVRIIEMCSPVTITLNCKVRLQSADLAYRLPQMIYNKYEAGQPAHFNDLMYDYQVPTHILTVLKAIWKLDRIKGEPAGISFYSYLMKNTQNNWQVNTNRNIKDEYEVVVPKVNLCTLGVLDYSEDKPSPVKTDRLSLIYETNFTYTIQFGMPTVDILQFPCVINNQLVPAQYIPFDKHSRWNQMPESRVRKQYEFFIKTDLRPQSDVEFLRVPYYDDWFLPSYQRPDINKLDLIAILGVLVDENETLSTEVDLADDSDPSFSLQPVVKEFLYQEGADALGTRAPFMLRLYRNDKQLLANSDYTFSDDLILRFNAINLHDQYRVCLFLTTSIYNLDPKWWNLLAKYFVYLPSKLKGMFIAFWKNYYGNSDLIGPDGKVYPKGWAVLGPDGWIYIWDPKTKTWQAISSIDKFDCYEKGGKHGSHSGSRVVQNTIIAKRS